MYRGEAMSCQKPMGSDPTSLLLPFLCAAAEGVITGTLTAPQRKQIDHEQPAKSVTPASIVVKLMYRSIIDAFS